MRIHRQFGSGLLEKAYQSILVAVLVKAGHEVDTEVNIPIEFDGVCISDAFRADIIVDGKLIIELKAVEKLLPSHYKQVGTYVMLSGLPLGLLVNFQEGNLQHGMHRFKLDELKAIYMNNIS